MRIDFADARRAVLVLAVGGTIAIALWVAYRYNVGPFPALSTNLFDKAFGPSTLERMMATMPALAAEVSLLTAAAVAWILSRAKVA